MRMPNDELEFNNEEKLLKDYFIRNPKMKDVLPEVLEKIKQYFPSNLGIYKSFVDNHDRGEMVLFLYVKGKESLDEMMHNLSRFEDEWWLNHKHFLDGKLFVNVMCI